MKKPKKEFFTQQELFSGPPPSIGWWPATIHGLMSPIRWWNGEHWSACAFKDDHIKQVMRMAQTPADPLTEKDIKWAQPWW